MRNIIQSLCIVLFLSTCSLYAQEQNGRNLNFYFITQDVNTPTNKLIEVLSELYNNAIYMKEPAIFYLTNDYEPIIVKVNTKDDNRNDFENQLLRSLIVKNYHSVGGKLDYNNIIDIVGNENILENGNLNKNLNISFYVGKEFWDMGYNESIIAATYFTLDCVRYKDNGLTFEVYSSDAKIINDANIEEKTKGRYMLFGTKNINGISDGFSIFEY